MSTHHFVAALVFVLLAGVAWGIYTPPTEPVEPRTVDLSESPEQVAYDAMLETRERDFTATIVTVTGTNESGEEVEPQKFATYRMENTERQFLVDQHWRSDNPRVFTNRYYSWVRYESTGEVNRVPVGGQRPQTRFENPSAVLTATNDVTIITDTEETLAIEVNGSWKTVWEIRGHGDLNSRGPDRVTLTLYVDKESRHLRRAEVNQSWVTETDDGETIRKYHTTIERYRHWDDTEVKRPDWANYQLMEFVARLMGDEGIDKYRYSKS